jgi:hypothetical protein
MRLSIITSAVVLLIAVQAAPSAEGDAGAAVKVMPSKGCVMLGMSSVMPGNACVMPREGFVMPGKGFAVLPGRWIESV